MQPIIAILRDAKGTELMVCDKDCLWRVVSRRFLKTPDVDKELKIGKREFYFDYPINPVAGTYNGFILKEKLRDYPEIPFTYASQVDVAMAVVEAGGVLKK